MFFEAEAAYDSFEFGGGGAGFSETFEDDTTSEILGGGVIENFDVNLVAERCVFGGGIVNGDGFAEGPAVGLDEPLLALAGEGAGYFGDGSFEDFDDASDVTVFSFAFALLLDAGDDAVAADGVEGFTGWDEEVALGDEFFGSDEAETAAGGFEGADDAVGYLGQGDGAFGGDDDFAVLAELLDGVGEEWVLFVRDVESAGQRALFEGLIVRSR